jgi:mRNA-degrading endonuclease RelE of RelBE toxin-antitoxin system
MTYRIVIAATAQAEIDDFAAFASAYSEGFAVEQFTRLKQILTGNLVASPNTWGYFYVTGAPYRAYLFRIGRHTQYWLVYTVDEATKTVSLLRFWNARRDDRAFEI